MNSYFGKYPVAYLDFKCDINIKSYEQALDECMAVLQSAYKAHRYLCNSEKLQNDEKKRCKDWCAGGNNFKQGDVTRGLHYDSKKVFVLVDEYDSINMKALFTVTNKKLEEALYLAEGKRKKELAATLLKCKGEELKNIAQLSNGILSAALKGDEEVMKHVERAVIIRISHIVGVGIAGFNNVTPRPFLSKFAYVEHFGLTEDDVTGKHQITIQWLYRYNWFTLHISYLVSTEMSR